MSDQWGPKQIAVAIGGLVGAFYILTYSGPSFTSGFGAIVWAALWLAESERGRRR